MKICILLIDCLRPDHLGCYGYNKGTSPQIDKIARKSVIFENAYAQANWTYPSVYSMITGKYPSSLNVSWFNQKINSSIMTLPEFLSQKGFNSSIFSNFNVLLNEKSFSGHFDEMKKVKLDSATIEVFNDWLKTYRDSFLLFHTAEYIHEPFCADDSLVEMFLPDRAIREKALKSDTVKTLTNKSTTGNSIRKTIGKINKRLCLLSKVDTEYLLACYDAGIYQVDKTVGELYNIIQKCGDDFIFIMTADHGQCFMEHGTFGHGKTLYDEAIKVPLIIDYNGCKNSKVSKTVQLMDIFPSILDFLQIEPDFAMNGTSFSDALFDRPLKDRIAFSEGYPHVTIRENNYKLISSYSKFWETEEITKRFSKAMTRSRIKDIISRCLRYLPVQLYDLERDKREKVNLRWSKKNIYNDLNPKIEKILLSILQDSLPSENHDIDHQIKKQLKSLGYL